MARLHAFVGRLLGAPLPAQIVGVLFLGGVALQVQRDGQPLIDLFLTADQQGRLLFDDRRYREAAAVFRDPAWQGVAAYRSGDYEGAADSFARGGDAAAFLNRGNAYLRAFRYRDAVTAYEQSVAEAPTWVEARENLALARHMLAYVEREREQTDTGENSGIGADDIVYDGSGERGAETEVTRDAAVEAPSAEKWMRTVDTETAAFLRTRFLLEANRRRGA